MCTGDAAYLLKGISTVKNPRPQITEGCEISYQNDT